ncbi:MAG: phosphoribosylformylglycinamidine synthase subunit PurL [Planctomycetaceae bacterium]|nr:phosphoribosylformylglycinamidine synthase subunit PurL [Planctomycetaceae bacterium]
MNLWEIQIHPVDRTAPQADREGARVTAEAHLRGLETVVPVSSARSYLIEGDLSREDVERVAVPFLVDSVIEIGNVQQIPESAENETLPGQLLNVLFKPGVTDNVGETALKGLQSLGVSVSRVATCRKYWVNASASSDEVIRFVSRVLSNDAIEHVLSGPLQIKSLTLGTEYEFELRHTSIRNLSDAELMTLSKEGQLYLQLAEMQTIRKFFVDLGREPTDIELETLAQTWSEHCSHKTLAGRIAYRDENGERRFENMLKETVFAATQTLRKQWGDEDWCVSVFKDNAGVVTFDDEYDVCFKVETHNHPSALEPYGGANTGLGGVIRDPLGTGMGAKPVCNTDVFCFAPPETPYDSLPPGTLHPRTVMRGVVSGVRDYGNRMGIPTVNGAVYFDDRYLGNPLVYCGNVAMIPRGKSEKQVHPGDYIVAVGGRTGRDGIHGATFSSAELTEESESLSGGAVQIGNAITEKMVMDVLLEARDRNLYNAVTDCGAGGFSSAVGEMGEESGAEVWLDKAPLKYSGLSYTEIWISEAQERMVLSVGPHQWEEFHALCASEGVEATIIGKYTDTERLVLKYGDVEVGNLPMSLLHDGRPPVVREATFQPKASPVASSNGAVVSPQEALLKILASHNVASKEWIIRQYDHEVQAGSVIKPLVGIANDGPSDAAVIRPRLTSKRGLVISCGMNPHFGDHDPYWMAASAIDEAMRNCVAVGADPQKIAILDNFCWGNTERAETLGSLVRAALACHDVAIAFGTPFISGKDSLNNEFRYQDGSGNDQLISIPPSLLISALGQVDDIESCVTMDLKSSGNLLYQIGQTHAEFGGSHYNLVTKRQGGEVPRVDLEQAPKTFALVHQAITAGTIRSCHDISEGGLAAAVAEMAFAGGLGVDVSLAAFGKMDETAVLFSESNTRFVVEVELEQEAEFLSIVPHATKLGQVVESSQMNVKNMDGNDLISVSLSELKAAWQRPFM